MKRSRNLIYGLIFLLVLSLRFPAQAEDKIRIGISGLSPGFVPTIIAEKKGYYAKYGLQSEHVVISLAIAINAMGTGDLDYVISLAQGISAFLRGFPVKLVMMTQDKLDFFIMGRPEIQKMADLKGKILGISYPGSTTHLVAEALLRQFGLEPGKDVNLLPAGDNQARLTALESGRVAAIVTSPPYNIIAPTKGLKVLLWARERLVIPQNAVILTEKKLQQSPDQVKKMIKGTIEALQFMRRNKEEAIDIAARWMRIDRPKAKAVLDSTFPLYSTDGTMTDEALQAALDVEIQRANIQKKVSISEIADRRLLLEAQKELGLR